MCFKAVLYWHLWVCNGLKLRLRECDFGPSSPARYDLHTSTTHGHVQPLLGIARGLTNSLPVYTQYLDLIICLSMLKNKGDTLPTSLILSSAMPDPSLSSSLKDPVEYDSQ